MDKLEKLFFCTSCEDVAQICNPFFDRTGITYFNHSRLYSDSTGYFLTSNDHWTRHFFENNYHTPTTVGGKDISQFSTGFFLWDSSLGGKLLTTASHDFDIDNGIAFVNKMQDYCDFYIFGSPQYSRSMKYFYLSNIDILQLFICRFNDVGQNLIAKAYDERIALVNNSSPNLYTPHDLISFNTKDTHKLSLFLDESPIHRFRITVNNRDVYITMKETLCLARIMQGQSIKAIANELNISSRTAETHINNIKNKLGCSNKQELIKLLNNTWIESILRLFRRLI